MKLQWKAAVMILPLAAVLAACTQDATEPSARPVAPSDDGIEPFPYDRIYRDGGYYGSGHREPPPPPPTDPGPDTTAVT
jgi:hypothetical protein